MHAIINLRHCLLWMGCRDLGVIYSSKHQEGRLEGDKGSLEDSGFLYAKPYGEMCSTNRIFSAESKVLGFGKQD